MPHAKVIITTAVISALVAIIVVRANNSPSTTPDSTAGKLLGKKA